jgi:hypothetical protein
MRVIDRIHRHTPNGRTNAAPAHCAGLADLAQTVFFVTNLANRRTTLDVNPTNLA